MYDVIHETFTRKWRKTFDRFEDAQRYLTTFRPKTRYSAEIIRRGFPDRVLLSTGH